MIHLVKDRVGSKYIGRYIDTYNWVTNMTILFNCIYQIILIINIKVKCFLWIFAFGYIGSCQVGFIYFN